MKHIFTPLASKELNSVIDYYEEIDFGLGLDFYDEFTNSISKILRFPSAWTKLDDAFRRYLIKRFPYAIIYRFLNKNIIEIVAVINLHRMPDFWKERL